MDAPPKKIVVDVRLLARGGTSGIPEYTRRLIDNVLATDRLNKYALFYPGFHKKPLPRSWALAPRCSVIDIPVPNKLLDISARFFKAPKFDHWLDADLVFSPHFNILALRKTPRVITFHDLSFLHHPRFFSRKQRFWHWLQHYKHQAESAQKIIAVSEFTKSDIVNLLGVPEEKINVVYSGIAETFRPQSGAERKNFKKTWRIDFPFILYLGTLEPRKNVEAVIRAFTIVKKQPALKNLRLIIAGRRGWLYKNILTEAQKSPYRDHIIFKRTLADRDRAALMDAAEVFVFPSFFEGFGFPPLEAQACGTPVIVSNRTSLLEVMGKSALYINPWRVTELAENIEYLLLNPEKHKLFADRGRRNARRFNWRKTANETLEIFRHA